MDWIGRGWRKALEVPWAFAWLALGCSSSGPETAERSMGSDTEEALAWVAGSPISASAVEREMRDDARQPIEALEKAIVRAALLHAANARNLETRESVRAAGDRQAVRELLRRDVEGQVTADSIAEAELRAFYDQQKEHFVRDERRTVTQLLMPLAADASTADEAQAMRMAEEVVEQAGRQDPQAVFEAWETSSVKIEDLGSFTRQAPFVEPFLDGAFSVSEPGVVPEGVRTKFGVHVIWVKAIQPAASLSFLEVRDRLLHQLLLGKRQDRLREVIGRARRRFRPQINPARLAALDELEGSRAAP